MASVRELQREKRFYKTENKTPAAGRQSRTETTIVDRSPTAPSERGIGNEQPPILLAPAAY